MLSDPPPLPSAMSAWSWRSTEDFSSFMAFRASTAASISDLVAAAALRARTVLPCDSTADCFSARVLRRDSSVAAIEE